MAGNLEAQFDDAMMDIYVRAKKEAKYTASRYLEMLHEHRGLETARMLINATEPSAGFTSLWEAKRLDLTVEALVIRPEWSELFEPDEIERARERLKQYKYPV